MHRLVKYDAISNGPGYPSVRGDMCTPSCEYMKNDFLKLALAYDSPRIISFLVQLDGAFYFDADGRSELPRLCLTLAMVDYCPQAIKDKALIIACKYTLPRTAGLLLAKGADPNNMYTDFGGRGPLHAAFTDQDMALALQSWPL